MIVVVAGVTTLSATTATLTVPVVVALAAAGLACSVERGKPHGAIPPLVTAAVVFCADAAPVVMSGEATFAGYIKLDTAGDRELAAGVHDVELRYSRSVATPGSGGPEYGFGPLVVSRDEARC